ncbi:MAG: LysE family transporter [Hyphomicrobiaceae bacterium]
MIGGPELILTGLGIGLIVAAPVGPVNVLCIQRALERGFWGGLAAGLGAVIGDGLIALFAAFGITAITGAIAAHKPLIKVIGGGVLVLFGLKLFFTRPTLNGNGQARSNAGGNMLLTIPQTFFLTITNPGAVLGMLGIFGSLGTALGGIEDYDEALIVVAAIMVGSTLWWAALAGIISRIRHKLTERSLRLINQVAGIVLMGFGLALAGEVAFDLIPG